MTEEEIREAENFLARTPYSKAKEKELMENFKKTVVVRRKFIKENKQLSATLLLQKYRLLQHTVKAVSEVSYEFL